MRIRLNSSGGSISLDVPGETLVGALLPASPSPEAQLATALEAPLGYPPLDQAILPGDRVTLVVDAELPQAASVVSDLIGYLLRSGHAATELTVLVSSRSVAERLTTAWPDSWVSEVQVIVHDPADDNAHAYLAATREGRPIYLHRAIGDADVVIPLGVLRPSNAIDDRGVHGSWFPAFSNVETQLRHQSPGNIEWKTHQRRRRSETDEAAWLLGVRLMVQVLPGPGDSIAAVWCGDAEEVARVGGKACHELWSHAIDRPAELVVATLDSAQPSWRQVARALASLGPAVAPGGAIVLWTELADDPGPALRSLGRFGENEDEQRLALLKHRSADATAAKVIVDCLQTSRVYLHSGLDDALVEDIGLAPLHDVAEIQRLIGRAASCLLVASAQYASVHIKQPAEA